MKNYKEINYYSDITIAEKIAKAGRIYKDAYEAGHKDAISAAIKWINDHCRRAEFFYSPFATRFEIKSGEEIAEELRKAMLKEE